MNDRIDKTLEEYLDGRSPVSRGYAELGGEQPPAALDRSILAAASSAVAREEDATVIRVRHWRKWSVPAALAATVVVAVPLVVRTIDLGIDEQPSMPERQAVASKSDGDASFDLMLPEALVEEPRPAAGAAPQSTAPAARPAPVAPGARREAAIPTARPEPAAPAERRRDDVASGFEARSATADSAVASGDRERPRTDPFAGDAASAALSSETPAALADQVAARREQAEDETGAETAKMLRSLSESDLGPVAYRQVYPDRLLERIATLYREGQTHAARLAFGEFLVLYPDAALPDDFPLGRSEAIAPQRTIIREADDWLRGVAILADEGRVDAARQELARFFERYPDYELPAWFPLTREDAAPIER